ncbi:MAG: hypothetical protein ACRD19_12265, partial [Terriglobia bacterium]
AGLSIAARRYIRLGAGLLGVMILIFLVTIHPRIIADRPGDAFAARSMFGDFPGRLINFFKDLGLCGAAFLFSGAWSETRRTSGKYWVYDLGRVILATSIVAFGVLHFLYPAFGPGIPPMYENVPWPVPGHLFWVFLTGAVFIVAGVSIMIKCWVHWTALWLAVVILLFLIVTWVPQFPANPVLLYTGNWLKDFGIAGGVLVLAGTQRVGTTRCKPVREECRQRVT